MLQLTVFLCGTLVMVLEMTGARVLAPHVGTSAIVWTSLIGVILACLAAGAWAGGRYADKNLSIHGLSSVITCAGAGCVLTAFAHNAVGAGIASAIANIYLAALCAAICVFALPAFFFGMIAPYAIRLKIASVATSGATVGRLYALSTAGSILGTFLGGFLLISWFSSSVILWSVALAMLCLSIALYRKHPWLRLVLLVLCLFLAWMDQDFEHWLLEKEGRALIESPYNSIRVSNALDYAHDGAPVRLMATDPGYSQSGMLLTDPNELYFHYTRYYALGPTLVPGASSALMLGGGGYSVPKWLLSPKSGLPGDFTVDVVEIDPAMTATAKKYFALPDDPNLTVHHADARSFLNRQKKQYDLVFVDVFNSHYSIPFQMGTTEAFQSMARAVAPGGALLMNVISAVEGKDGRLFRAIWSNLEKVFPETRVYCVGNPLHPEKIQNLMLVGLAPGGNRINTVTTANPGQLSPDLAEIAGMEKNRYTKPIPDDTPALTDDYSPVERYALMLAR